MAYLFALFVNSGILKSLFGDHLILDITILTFTAILITLAVEILLMKRKINGMFLKNKSTILILIFIVLFTLFIIISSLYTQSPNYWKEKLARVLFLTLTSFLIPCFFFKLTDIKKFIIGSIVIYGLIIISFLNLLLKHGLKIFYMGKEVGPHYLIWASFIAFNSLLFIGLFLEKSKEKKKVSNWKIMFFSLVNIFIIFSSGARGPFLFFLFCVAGMVLFKKQWSIMVYVLIFCILLVSIYAFYGDFTEEITSIGRSERQFGLRLVASSVKKRLEFFEESWNLIKERPFFGYGIGSFSYITEDMDKRGYPHNIILETWLECGVLAALMFVGFLVCLLYISIKKIQNPFVFSFLWVNIYFILHLMKSSSLTDARVFFAFAGILFAAITFSMNDEKNFISER